MQAYSVRESAQQGRVFEYAPDVVRVATGIVNAYLVGTRERWMLVDTGIAGFAPLIQRAAESRFGGKSRPAAIVLTHGHFDHAGNANTLARAWDVPVYAHTLEIPYLTGRSNYPPIDPTVGGAIAAMSRMFPRQPPRVDGVQQLPVDLMSQMPGWGWIHTPGHTAGHVSLFRASDALLLAGEALVTMNMDSWIEQVRRTPEPCRPPAPLTTDWVAAATSVRQLGALEAKAIGAGHGLPIAGDEVAAAVHRFAETFTPPAHGRYVQSPARTGPDGVEWLPPAVPDPFPQQAMGAALVTLGAVGLAAAWRRPQARR